MDCCKRNKTQIHLIKLHKINCYSKNKQKLNKINNFSKNEQNIEKNIRLILKEEKIPHQK